MRLWVPAAPWVGPTFPGWQARLDSCVVGADDKPIDGPRSGVVYRTTCSTCTRA
jgi:hypothetical protein